MTEAEQLAAQATWHPNKVFKKAAADPAYKWWLTPTYRAAVALYEQVHVAQPPPQPPPTNALASLIQNVVYCAQNPLAALGAPAHWKPALTADPGYASFTTPSVVGQLRSRFGKVGAWGVQTQIGAQRMRDFQAQYGLDFLIFQGETSDEFDTALNAGARLIVGNANAWTDGQRREATALINQGTVLAFAQEAYTNLGNPWPDQTSTQGVPAASLVLGVYDGSGEVPGRGWYPSLADYRLHTPASVWPSVSVYHAAGVKDWGAL